MPDVILGFPGSLVTLGLIISTQRFIAFDLFSSLFFFFSNKKIHIDKRGLDNRS